MPQKPKTRGRKTTPATVALKIKALPVATLVPYARNARTHSPEQVDQIAASIREFGFNVPILVDAGNTIIAGHGRLLAAQKLGLATVPVIRIEHLTDAPRRAFMLADNKIAENAGWDEDFLKLEIEELRGLKFDVDLIGFGEDELAELFNVEPPDPEPAAPPTPGRNVTCPECGKEFTV